AFHRFYFLITIKDTATRAAARRISMISESAGTEPATRNDVGSEGAGVEGSSDELHIRGVVRSFVAHVDDVIEVRAGGDRLRLRHHDLHGCTCRGSVGCTGGRRDEEQ